MATAGSAAPPPQAGAGPERSIVARGVFATAADRSRFETEVLPAAESFLAYWREAGLEPAHAPVRLFISPPRGTKATDSLPALYGDSVVSDLRALEEAVAAAPSNRAAIELIDTFTCERPPLDRNFLEEVEEYVEDPNVSPADIAGALSGEHDELLGSEGTFSFRTDNGEFELPLRRNCSYLLLGHATDLTRAHPYLEADVVNHELGHSLHYGLWLESGPLGERLSTSANEAIADILAHVFDGDPCHGKILGESGEVVGCRRRMDTYEFSVSDAFWRLGSADHETGQSLRELVWSLRGEVPDHELRQAIAEGIAGVQVALSQIDAEPLANAPVFDDRILATRYDFVREYEASRAFFEGLCARVGQVPGGCDEVDARLGDPRLSMRETWLANAPTAIGQAGLTLADGRRVSFEMDGALIRQMTVMEPNGAAQAYLGDPDLGLPQDERDGDSGQITLWFPAPSPDSPEAQIGWSSAGELRVR